MLSLPPASRRHSPSQARLPEYNPLVMSKLFLLRDAARINPWGARYHLVSAAAVTSTAAAATEVGVRRVGSRLRAVLSARLPALCDGRSGA
jgi:hypothetical protein